MSQIVQLGAVNLASLNVPQVLVQVVPPQFLYGGVQTNVGGVIGTASWGPTNSPQPYGTVGQAAQIFGPTINRLYDIVGHSTLAMAQGANFLYGVRVTDGTDTAASAPIYSPAPVAATGTVTFTVQPVAASTMTLNGSIWTFVAALTTGLQILIGSTLALTLTAAVAALAASADVNTAKMSYSTSATVLTTTAVATGTGGNALTLATDVTGATVSAATLAGGAAGTLGMTLTGKYTGSNGQNLKGQLGPGSKYGSYKLVVILPGNSPEVYDNITGSGLALWINLCAAVNNGNSSTRGPSAIVVATVGTATVAPITGTNAIAFTGGTDGASTVTTSTLVGVDTLPRTGMYCLRNTGVSKAMIADLSDSTSWSTQVAFGLSIGCEMIATTPAGDTITNAATEVALAGIDSFTLSIMFGDWVYWLDTYNGIPMRLSSPQSVKLGVLCALSPQNNPLNKPIQGIIGTQKTQSGLPYTDSDLQIIGNSQMDVVGVNPMVGTTYFSCLFGKNTSSNPVTQGDEYTQITYFLAKSLFKIGAPYVGAVQTIAERLQALTSILQFLALISVPVALGGPGILSSLTGGQPYQVILNATNNSQTSAALGFQNAYVKCVYGPIVRYFIFSLEGGASVIVSTTAPNMNQAA